MGNSTSQTLENSLHRIQIENFESLFNASVSASEDNIPIMTRSDFVTQFPALSQTKLFGQQYYQLFDVEGLDSIDFNSFFAGLTVLVNQKMDLKFDALFRMLDPAGNGVLQEYELLGFVEKSFEMLHSIDPTIDWDNPFTVDILNSSTNQSKIPQKNPTLQNSSSPSALSSHAVDQQFCKVPIRLGPLQLSFNSQKIVDQGLAAIGQVSAPASTPTISLPNQHSSKSLTTKGSGISLDAPPLPVIRSVNKNQFGLFIRASPQLLLTVLWALNISFIQYICMQTRLQFIQQCEAQLVSEFPMCETKLLEQYHKIASFYHEILLRRLAAGESIKEGTLLQHDIITIKQNFNSADNNSNNSSHSSLFATPSSTVSTPRRTTPRFSFSRAKDDPDQTLPGVAEHQSGLAASNSTHHTLFPKLTPFNYPYTYSLPDSAVQLSSIGSTSTINIIPATVVGESGQYLDSKSNKNPHSPPVLTHTPSHNRSRPQSVTRIGDTGKEQSSQIELNQNRLIVPFDIPNLNDVDTKGNYSLFSNGAFNMDEIDCDKFVKTCYPDTLGFTVYFLNTFKLVSLLHRNRLASRVLCHGLIRTVQGNLNDSYVTLITNQFLFQVKTQFVGKKNEKNNYHGSDINQKLLQTLEKRKSASKNNDGNILIKHEFPKTIENTIIQNFSPTPTKPTKKIARRGTAFAKSGSEADRPVLEGYNMDGDGDDGGDDGGDDDDDNDDDHDDDDDDDDSDDDLNNLGKIEDYLNPTIFTNDSDDNNVEFGTAAKKNKKNKKNSTKKTIQKTPKKIPPTKNNPPHANPPPESTTIATIPLKSLDDSDNDGDDNLDVNAEADPGNGHLMTESMIPNFLEIVTKAIQNDYTPQARGPYSLPFLTDFIREYIPDALGQLLAAYRFVMARKIKTQTQKETEVLLTDIQDYIDELLTYKHNVQDQFTALQVNILEYEELLEQYKSQHDDLTNDLLLTKEQNFILKTELTDVISVKDMAIITLRDELQFFTKENQHWSDQIAKLNQQVALLKQEKLQKDVEIAQLHSQKEAGCCSIM